MPNEKYDASGHASRRKNPFVGTYKSSPMWEIFTRMAAHDARRKERVAERQRADEAAAGFNDSGTHLSRFVTLVVFFCAAYILVAETFDYSSKSTDLGNKRGEVKPK